MIGKYKIVGICVSRCGDTVISRLIEKMNQMITAEDYRIFIYNTCSDLYWNRASEKGDASVFDLINYDQVDVLVIFDEKLYDKEAIGNIISRAQAKQIPVIVLGGHYSNCINMNFDYVKGMENIVRHILDTHQPKTLHFIAGSPGNPQSDERIRIFRQVLEEKGYDWSDDMLSYGEFWSEPTVRVVKRLIEENRVPEAIICANDIMAVHTMGTLRDYGYDVPGDVMVTGFDGIDDAKYARPQITTCECSYEHIYQEIADMLAEAVAGNVMEGDYLLEPRTVIGGSCGCTPKKTISISERVIALNNRLYRFHEDDYSFGTISAKMMACHELEEAAHTLSNKYVVFDAIFALKPECIDETKDPSMRYAALNEDEEMCLFFDSDYPDRKPYLYAGKEFLPNIHMLLAGGTPLIFSAIHNLEIPLGFSCFHFRSYDADNYDRLTQVVNCMNSAITGFRNVRYQRHLISVIEEMYQIDILTGLLNRRAFAERYQHLCEQAEQSEQPLTFVFLDLDGLKAINNSYGHSEGDNAIQTVARALQRIGPKRMIYARYGGDEMIGAGIGHVDEEDLRAKLEEVLSNYNDTSAKPYTVAASMGVYEAEPGDDMTMEALSSKADQRMYEQKSIRKGSSQYQASGMSEQ